MYVDNPRPARNPHYDTPWQRGSVGPSGSTEWLTGWVRVLPNGWAELVQDGMSPHGAPVVRAFSPASLVTVTYTGAWESE